MSRSTSVRVSSEQAVLEERQVIGRLAAVGSGPDAHVEVRRGARPYACQYDPDLAEQLVMLLGQWVVVRGVFRVTKHDDCEDDLLELCGIKEITPADTSPLVVDSVSVAGATLRFTPSLRLEPVLKDDLFLFEVPDLGVVTGAPTREEAEEEFRQELGWLWEHYVRGEATGFAPDALRLRRVFKTMAREEPA